MSELLFEQLGAIAGGCLRKEPDDLSPQEKLALAVVAGCAYRTEWKGGKLVVTTVNPVGFQKIDGKWRVCEGRTHNTSHG